jgi:hypothetical protein
MARSGLDDCADPDAPGGAKSAVEASQNHKIGG